MPARASCISSLGRACLPIFLALVLASPTGVGAALSIGLVEVASGLVAPVEMAAANDGSGRLFIVEQAGRIRILDKGVLRPIPFLDISASVSSGGERGLLGLAFHPRYAANGAFFVFYTRAGDGSLVVARYLRSGSDASVADPSSGVPLLVIPHAAFANHNGGKIAFGADGHLYIGTGDGGGGGDPLGSGQNLGSRLGKLLRIAVDGGTTYSVPSDNPYAASSCAAGACPEIWAYGLRNPWKFSFDRVTGDLFIGDVGQNSWEEIDLLPFGTPGGRNLGWNIFEGNHCFSPPCDPLPPSYVGPIIEYPHNAENGFSVTGGFRYRGSRIPPLQGRYLYGDFATGRVWSASANGDGSWSASVVVDPPSPLGSISSFGEDEAGELYVLDYSAGRLWRIDYPLVSSPRNLSFVSQPVGVTSGARRVTLSNNGSTGQSIGITGIAAAGSADFAVSGSSCPASLGVGGSCFVDVTFTPSTLGPKFGDLVVSTNLAGSPLRVGLVGNRNASAFVDFDGNGVDDLLWRQPGTGTNVIWLMQGGGSALAGSGGLPAVGAPWGVAAVSDFNGDGQSDLLWRDATTGQSVIWLVSGTAIAGGGALPVVGAPWAVAATGDFDGDGRADLLWRNGASGENVVWRMNGAAIVGGGALYAVPDPAWAVAGTGDFDGNGTSDLLWRNGVTGENALWLMGASGVSGGGVLATVPDTAWRIAGIGDFDGDGRSDLLWRNGVNGGNVLWLMNGPGVVGGGSLPTVPDAQWTVAQVSDFGPDGRADLLWRNTGTGQNILWLMNATSITGGALLPTVNNSWRLVPE